MRLLNRIMRRRGQTAPRPFTIELTDQQTVMAHQVTIKAFAAGRKAGDTYRALCGALVLPASLAAPERSHCPACERSA